MRKYKFLVLVAILLFVAPLTAVVSATNSPKTSIGEEATTDGSSSAPIDVEADFGKLPLSFIPNVGQSDTKVQFQTHAYGGTVFFTSEEIVLALPAEVEKRAEKEFSHHETELTTDKAIPITVARLSFEGREAAAPIYGTNKLPGIVNYYRGSDPDKWFSGVPTYGEIVYDELYPGIDLHYNSTQGQLKSTFIVAPRVNPNQIRWRYKGAKEVSVDQSGQLLVTLDMPAEFADSAPAILIEQAPIAWQEKNGEEVPVKIGYTVAPDGSIGFELGEYDRTKPLILDPTLTYSSYLGGSGTDYAFSNAVDSEGNLYVTGRTTSSNFPTSGPSSSLNGSSDAFVSKLNAQGNTLLYSTYLGGTGHEKGNGIALDDSGGAYITGSTNSTKGFPILNAFQSTFGGGLYDAFVIHLSNTGQLQFGTYLGGNDWDIGSGLVVGHQTTTKAVYITGETYSSNFPVQNAYQQNKNGASDGFVAQLTWTGSGQVQYSYGTYFGGNSYESASDIAVDQKNQVYITGDTSSKNFPTRNAYQGSSNGGTADAFVSKLNPAVSPKNQLIYSTYLGGGGGEIGTSIAVDGANQAYITGYTDSTDFPTQNALQGSKGGSLDAFVTKLNATGNAAVYSTYLGQSGDDRGYGIAVGQNGAAYLIGQTNSSDFYTVNAIQANHGGQDDVFIAKLQQLGKGLDFSSYLGHSDDDYGLDIAVDSSGDAYLVGYTASSNFPTTENAMDSSYNGGDYDGFMAKIALDLPTTKLAYFYITPNNANEHVAQIANRSKLVVLTKRNEDREFLNGDNGLRANGYTGKALQYVVANEIQDTSTGLLNNQWVYNEALWNEVNSNPEWYLYKADGTRINTGSFDYMDPGNLEWQNFVKERAVEFILDEDGRGDYNFDGIFLDNVDVTWTKVWRDAGGSDKNDVDLYKCTFNRRGQPSCEIAYADSQSYELAVQQFLQAIRNEFNTNSQIPSTHPRLLWGNMISDPYTGESWDPFMAYLDGGMFEGWLPGYPSTGGTLSAKQRRAGLIQAETLLDNGKEFLAVGQGNQGEINRQQYALAAYLLVVPANNAGQATFRYTRADPYHYDDWWYYENYDYQLGAPLGDYYEPVANMLQRDFENGHVTLNLDSDKSNIILNTP